VLRVILKTYGLLVFGLVLIEICLFFGLVLCIYVDFCFVDSCFFKFYDTFSVFVLLKAIWACFCEIVFVLRLFF